MDLLEYLHVQQQKIGRHAPPPERPVSLVYPNDRDAFDLTTDVMRHQLDTIKIQEFLFVNNPTDNEKVQVQQQ